MVLILKQILKQVFIMYIYMLIKILFLLLDSIALYFYLKVIKNNKFYGFLIISCIMGILCLYTSVMNINILFNNDALHEKQILYYEYIICRTLTFILEWCQYSLFLWFLFNNQTIKFLTSIIISVIIIYNNYVYLEILEYELTHITQYVSPFDSFL